ncbi:glutamate--tRNA ligase family protein [Persicirhabdus sediminis]|uniref:Glutamate--tRNA ligase n=1 Tax=Persicirhabdus sediminis TaxID=454144 RepID=A0A8J7MDJ3_9BACT|nr:glutamate--tRNA ligase family protein [Persicirhabdus sediminis]MBK1790681.1 glutamate--tRNA ligase [Persicirhabdus sediminis]
METVVRTRFAPSPTGYLHIGGARTALFNWLYARKHGGEFILRVEDTDKERNTEEARRAIFDSMNWLGLNDDEGPETGGEHGPYYQSQRDEIYNEWFAKLEEAGRVYEDEGAWRFRFERKPMVMQDMICGEVTVDYTDESNTPDMVVKRSDGSYVFHFVNVVDDLTMGITHVIRGDDHLMNTPKHLQLFEAFGVEPPKYAHLPLILNMDGSKMSKRDQGAAVGTYAPEGFLPEAVFNFISLLGWSPKDDSEIFSINEIVERFSLEGVNRSPGKFDIEKCAWVNQQHLLKLSAEEFAEAAKPFALEAFGELPENFTTIAASVQEKVSLLKEIPEAIEFFLKEDYVFAEDALAKLEKNALAKPLLAKLAEAFAGLTDWSEAKATIGATAKAEGAKPGQLMFPTRVALSGKAGGPDLGDILDILGKDESIRRVQRTLELLG